MNVRYDKASYRYNCKTLIDEPEDTPKVIKQCNTQLKFNRSLNDIILYEYSTYTWKINLINFITIILPISVTTFETIKDITSLLDSEKHIIITILTSILSLIIALTKYLNYEHKRQEYAVMIEQYAFIINSIQQKRQKLIIEYCDGKLTTDSNINELFNEYVLQTNATTYTLLKKNSINDSRIMQIYKKCWSNEKIELLSSIKTAEKIMDMRNNALINEINLELNPYNNYTDDETSPVRNEAFTPMFSPMSLFKTPVPKYEKKICKRKVVLENVKRQSCRNRLTPSPHRPPRQNTIPRRTITPQQSPHKESSNTRQNTYKIQLSDISFVPISNEISLNIEDTQ